MPYTEDISFHVSFQLSGRVISITDGDENIEMNTATAKELAERILKVLKKRKLS